MLGDEEEDVIEPAVKRMKGEGINCKGPSCGCYLQQGSRRAVGYDNSDISRPGDDLR